MTSVSKLSGSQRRKSTRSFATGKSSTLRRRSGSCAGNATSQESEHGLERLCSMADLHLVGNGRFTESAAERLVKEQRVIAESLRTTGFVQDSSFDGSPKCAHQLRAANQRDHADESRTSVGRA